ncbi:hypothetical protein [Nocardia noduli]|uniref:hypothetical protein n=1 Tax=Nocardia noduli TaxID=2815722 RepID=UPI001C22C37A|nr:hypothetical protein [Nocardia noduli]
MGRFERGRETVGTLAKRGGQVVLIGLRVLSVVSMLVNVVGNDDAASTAMTVLAAIGRAGRILVSVTN